MCVGGASEKIYSEILFCIKIPNKKQRNDFNVFQKVQNQKKTAKAIYKNNGIDYE